MTGGGPPEGGSGDLRDLFARVPEGPSVVAFEGRRWRVARTARVGGRSQAVYAEELGGNRVVSANLYLVHGSARLRPCEMPAADVLEFLRRLEVQQTPTAPVPSRGAGAVCMSGLRPEVRQ